MSNRMCRDLDVTDPKVVSSGWPAHLPVRRIDLHCHSDASNEADEALLNSIQCPESFSSPAEVFDQARRRGMDFVTLTDHDSLTGVNTLLKIPGVLTGEELTCYFPEDQCKIHLLVWGLTDADHDALQADRAGYLSSGRSGRRAEIGPLRGSSAVSPERSAGTVAHGAIDPAVQGI